MPALLTNLSMTTSEMPASEKNNELVSRVKTALPAALLVIGIMLYVPVFVVGIVVLLLTFVGIYEFDEMLQQKVRLNLLVMMGSTFFMGGATILGGMMGLMVALVVVSLGLFFYYLLFTTPHNIADLQVLGISLFGILWIPWSLNHLTLIRGLPEGTAFLFLLVLSMWMSDIAAYFGGKSFGRMLLAPSVSPKKTIEGSICGALGAGIVAAVFCFFFIENLGWITGSFVGIGVSLIGQVGDLLESKIKRLCAVKNSGTIFPGHGGMLDRVDGFLTATPVFFYFMSWIS